ncbi:MAG: hypothetical protein OXR73_08120 [Myxococcales bacterium]|nr:hypothetical protein [Myxococcales bacterium]
MENDDVSHDPALRQPAPRLPLLAGVALLCCTSAAAQEGQGFAELRLAMSPGAEGELLQVVERTRPSFTADIAERLTLSTTIEAALVQGRDPSSEAERVLAGSDLGPVLARAGCSFPPYDNATLRVNRSADYLDVDRLFLDAYLPWADVRVGRQAVHWGSAQFFNPTDPFPQVLLAEPWRPRRGVNAARVTVPFGDVHDAKAIVATDDVFGSFRGAGRVKLNWLETDVAVNGNYRSDTNVGFVGLDVRGTLGVGYWLEGGVRLDSDPHEEFVVGVDYSFPLLERLVLVAQYYRNGSGATDPDDYHRGGPFGAIAPPTCEDPAVQALVGTRNADPFAQITAARDYLMLGAMLGATLDLTLNLFWLHNLNDGTGFVVPTVVYALLGWLDVSVSAQIPFVLWGQGGEFRPRDTDLAFAQVDPASGQTLRADFSGLLPAAVITLWTRASF